jgi:hypothetical protein
MYDRTIRLMLQTILHTCIHTTVITLKHSFMVSTTTLQATISTLKHSFMLYYSEPISPIITTVQFHYANKRYGESRIA